MLTLRFIGSRITLIFIWLAMAASVRAVNPVLPTIPSKVFLVTDYGAVGNGVKDNTVSIQNTINAASAAGGGMVEIPAGTFLSGPITLASRINLHVDAGGTLEMEPLGTYPGGMTNADTFITARQAEDLELSGWGRIDGQGAAWWQAMRDNRDINRPMMLQFYSCHRLFIHDITYHNPPNHHCGLRQFGGDITISNLTVDTDPDSPNTDGLNFVGTNSIIENCHIADGDDNIAMGATGPIDGLLITNCVFGYGHGVSIGSGARDGIRNLEVANCSFTGGEFGIRMKADLESGGLVHELFYHDLTMRDVQMPILIYSYYRSAGSPGKISKITPAQAAKFPMGEVTRTTPIWRDITFSNITATASVAGGTLWGLPQMPISNIHFVNVDISGPGPFNIYNARNIRFDHCNIQLRGDKKFVLYNAQGVTSSKD